jgi:hypothetical protein
LSILLTVPVPTPTSLAIWSRVLPDCLSLITHVA